MRDIPDAICWSEGMHLLPQHLQLQGLRAESLSARLAENAQPWYWGVQNIQIDTLTLSSGKILVTALDAVMPDGLVVNLDPVKDRDHPLTLTLTTKDFGEQHTLTVYLAVKPLWRSHQLRNLNGRLRSDTSSAIPDLSTGEFAQTLRIWRPHLRLVTTGKRADSECIPLLRLSHEGSGLILLPYLPPCPVLPTASPVSRRIGDVCFLARTKCEYLAGRFREAQQTGKPLESAELRSQLRAIWARLPELQSTLETGIAHPATLYLQLVGFAGALAGLQPEAGVPNFGALKFEELQQGFDEVLRWIEVRLNSIRAGYHRRSFDYEDRQFSIAMTDTLSREQQLVIGLRMPSGSTSDAAYEWLTRAIIASRTHLQTLIRQRMHGLNFQPLEGNDQVTYSVGENVRLFSIHARGEWFEPETKLYLYMPPNSGWVEPTEIMIFDASKLD